jgi:hypothetical protein
MENGDRNIMRLHDHRRLIRSRMVSSNHTRLPGACESHHLLAIIPIMKGILLLVGRENKCTLIRIMDMMGYTISILVTIVHTCRQ